MRDGVALCLGSGVVVGVSLFGMLTAIDDVSQVVIFGVSGLYASLDLYVSMWCHL